MLDAPLRPLQQRLFEPLARRVGPRVSPALVTAAALAAGLATAWCAWRGAHGPALAWWVANRALDAFDGPLARAHGRQSALGGYLDILGDFVTYAAVPVALALHAPTDAPLAHAALVLLASFYVNAASWMYLSALLERRGAGAAARGEPTAVTMPAGLVGGTETALFYAVFLLFPTRLVPLFLVMAAAVLAGVLQRVAWAARTLRD